MSAPLPFSQSVLAIQSGFSEEEEVTGIHRRALPERDSLLPSELLEDVADEDAHGDAHVLELSPDDDSVEEIADEAPPAEEEEEEVKAEEEVRAEEPEADGRMIAQASLPPPAPPPAREARRARPSVQADAPMMSPAKRKAIAAASIALLVGVAFGTTGGDRSVEPAASVHATNETAEPAEGLVIPSSVPSPAAAATFGPPAPEPKAAAESAPKPAPQASAPRAAAPRATATSSLVEGDRALKARDFASAESHFQAALARGGADHEALVGLGRVAAARGATTDAMAFFERSVAIQPGYLPARLGLADVLWDAGRKDAAIAQYREIRARFANEVYPARVVERTR